jgi:type II secretory pathway pseudopilin PulG
MKLLPANMRSNRACASKAAVSAFTVVEMTIVALIFSWLIISLVGLQIFGLRIYTLAATKISATAGGRKVLNQMRDQIRQASQVYVGNCTVGSSTFVQISGTNAAQGNALQIIFSTNAPKTYVLYYLDTNSIAPTNVLKEYVFTPTFSNNIVVSTNINTFTLASYITNLIVFDAEDYTNNILTNSQNNQVIRVTLQFSQWEYPIAVIGGQALNAYDYYQLRTKITRRAPEID